MRGLKSYGSGAVSDALQLVAIVALGKVQLLPRFDTKGHVVARSIMQVSWSGDHRVIDGGTIARFTNLWKKYLEEPSAMLVAMR